MIVSTNETFENLRTKYPMDYGKEAPERKIGKVFNRFYADQKGYKAYLVILATYCLINIDDERKIKKLNINELVESIEEILERNDKTKELDVAVEKIFRTVAFNALQHFSGKEKDFDSTEFDNEIRQYLSQYISRTPLASYYLSFGLIGLN